MKLLKEMWVEFKTALDHCVYLASKGKNGELCHFIKNGIVLKNH